MHTLSISINEKERVTILAALRLLADTTLGDTQDGTLCSTDEIVAMCGVLEANALPQ